MRCLGTPDDVGAALADKATLVNLWASWCVPCGEKMPVLATYAERPGSIPAFGVNFKEPASAGLTFMAEIGLCYPSLYDGDTEGEETVQQALRTPPVLPVNYLVRPDGIVERVTDPLVFRSPQEIQSIVDRLLGTSW
ncbi:TlpA family protein disulfide reductase [Actinophytocola sp.]|uniref:TlpA family protein disulfide reductase n=1 Tax=Actinophytocola sp. TaxID=1872138 RepID=UPI003899F358